MPDDGVMDSSVLFFVSVALDVLILEKDIYLSPFWTWSFFNFACHAGRHVAHHVVEFFLLDTGRTQVRTAAADGLFRLIEGAPELACRADIHAGAA
jgi:hypothetical protein